MAVEVELLKFVFYSIFPILILLFILLFVFKKNLFKALPWISSLLGGSYALIVNSIYSNIGGEKGLIFVVVPALWPALVVFLVVGGIIASLAQALGLRPLLLDTELMWPVLNIIIWIIIGFFIGKLIKKMRENYVKKGKKQENELIWSLGVGGAFLGFFLTYFYSGLNFYYLIIFTFVGALLGYFIGCLIKGKRRK